MSLSANVRGLSGGAVQCSAVQCSAVQCSAVQHRVPRIGWGQGGIILLQDAVTTIPCHMGGRIEENTNIKSAIWVLVSIALAG